MPTLREYLNSLVVIVEEKRVEPDPKGIELVRLLPHQCRWPLEDGTFCGADIEEPVFEGHEPVYCKGHAQRAYRTRIITDE